MEPFLITLEGHLTKDQLQQQLDKIESELEALAAPRGLIVDCERMTGYDSAARSAFVEWNRRWRNKISRVAIVTDNVLWHMVIKMMAKVSTQQMKDFTDLGRASEWVQD